MEILSANQKQWKEIKQIYFEAFPKSERKPFFIIKSSVKKEKRRCLPLLKTAYCMAL